MKEHSGYLFERQRVGNPAWKVYMETFTHGMKAVIVGPSHSLTSDPLLFFTSVSARVNGGSVFVADPLGKETDWTLKNTLRSGWIEPVGSVEKYLHELEMFRQLGIDMSVPKWLGPGSGIFKIANEQSWATHIFDHATSPYVLCARNLFPGPLLTYMYKKVLRNYWNTLVPGGTLIIQVNDEKYRFGQGSHKRLDLEKLLYESYFVDVQKIRVDDEFQIPISDKLYQHIQQSQGGKRIAGISSEFLVSYAGHYRGTYFLTIPAELHKSPHLYKAKKPFFRM